MRRSEPGRCASVAIHTSRGTGLWVVSRFRMKYRRLAIIALVAVALCAIFYVITSYRHGRTDFDAVSERKPPVYAKERLLYLDGGTVGYRGRGYVVFEMHRILMGYGNNPPEGYLGGAKIQWQFPTRLFARDDDSFHYIPGE